MHHTCIIGAAADPELLPVRHERAARYALQQSRMTKTVACFDILGYAT
jgi:hypothetical protein